MLDKTDCCMDVGCALFEGQDAVQTILTGGELDLEALDRSAKAFEVLRDGIANGTMWAGWVMPNDEDVRVAQRLLELARSNAPREELIEPARHVFRVTADPTALNGLCHVLLWLAGEATRIPFSVSDDPRLDRVYAALDRAIAFFERGGNVAGFVPTPEDLSRVQRLRALVTADAGEALAERQRLAKEMWARVPQDNVSEGVRRMATEDER
jgi:hypothetical protein